MSVVCLLLLLLPLVSAQTYHWGPCPTPKVQPGFDLQKMETGSFLLLVDELWRKHQLLNLKDHIRETDKPHPNWLTEKYLGRWYEIQKLPASFERGKCIEANYSIRKDGTIRVLNSQFYKDKIRVAEGTAVVQDLREPAKIGVSFSYFTPYSPYYILTTDYSSLAVVYSCTDILRLFHVDYAWILSRSRFLPAENVRYAQELLLNEGIDLFRMKATDQTGCKDN